MGAGAQVLHVCARLAPQAPPPPAAAAPPAAVGGVDAQDHVEPGQWKELYKARHCDEVDLNLEANSIVEASMEQLAQLKSALARQRQQQEAKLEQRLLLRRALRRCRLTRQAQQQERETGSN